MAQTVLGSLPAKQIDKLFVALPGKQIEAVVAYAFCSYVLQNVNSNPCFGMWVPGLLLSLIDCVAQKKNLLWVGISRMAKLIKY